MLNLQEFVTEALVQIVEGVKAAQKRVEFEDAMINPRGMQLGKDGRPLWESEKPGFGGLPSGQNVEFDVAVTTTDNKDIKGGIGVVGGLFNVGYTAGKDIASGSVSRIKFSVPVFLPEHTSKYHP